MSRFPTPAPHRYERRAQQRSQDDPDEVLARLPVGTRDWRRVLAAIVRKHNSEHALLHKSVSFKTQHDRKAFLFAFTEEVRKHTQYRNFDPRQLGARHIEVMVKRWVDRGLSTATIHNYLSFLRTFAGWLGKPGLVRSPEHYVGAESVHAHRVQVASEDQSWTSKGIDVAAKIEEIEAFDNWVGLQLRLCLEFGVRGREARHFRPHGAIRTRAEAFARDAELFPEVLEFVRFEHGTKGGRPRDVPLIAQSQRDLLDECAKAVAPGSYVGYPGRTWLQNQGRFYYVLKKFGICKAELGVVAHGLRHQAAHVAFEADAGHAAPVRGGTVGSDGDVLARQRTALRLGHGRVQVVAAYIGSSRRASIDPDAQDEAMDEEPAP